MDIKFDTAEGIFSVRVRALIINGNKLLAMHGEIRRHKVGGRNAAQRKRIVVRPAVAHNPHRAQSTLLAGIARSPCLACFSAFSRCKHTFPRF